MIQELDVSALVAAIAGHVGDLAFNARELVAHARTVGGPLAVALGGRSARRVGKVLSRLIGQNINGWRIERVGADRDGAIYAAASVEETRKAAS